VRDTHGGKEIMDSDSFIEPGARRALVKRRIREVAKAVKEQYRPRLKAAASAAEKARIERQMNREIQERIQSEGLTDVEYDDWSLY